MMGNFSILFPELDGAGFNRQKPVSHSGTGIYFSRYKSARRRRFGEYLPSYSRKSEFFVYVRSSKRISVSEI
jgi:hypothetical protein